MAGERKPIVTHWHTANTLRNMDIMDYPDYPDKTPCLHLGLGTPTLVAGRAYNEGYPKVREG